MALMSKSKRAPIMPEFVEAGLNQLTTTQANRSRLVTKCRFVVEAVNGQLKQRFGLFNQV